MISVLVFFLTCLKSISKAHLQDKDSRGEKVIWPVNNSFLIFFGPPVMDPHTTYYYWIAVWTSVECYKIYQIIGGYKMLHLSTRFTRETFIFTKELNTHLLGWYNERKWIRRDNVILYCISFDAYIKTLYIKSKNTIIKPIITS